MYGWELVEFDIKSKYKTSSGSVSSLDRLRSRDTDKKGHYLPVLLWNWTTVGEFPQRSLRYTPTHTHTHTDIYIYICIYVCMCMYMYMYVYECIYVYMYVHNVQKI